MSSLDSKSKFDIQRFLSLGREFSDKHKDFQFLAHLGNEYSKKRAALEFMFFLKDGKDEKKDLKAKLMKAVELLGEAELLTLTKAWERMTLALGDTTPRRPYRKTKSG